MPPVRATTASSHDDAGLDAGGTNYVGRGPFLILLLGATGGFIGHSFINTYGFQIVESTTVATRPTSACRC